MRPKRVRSPGYQPIGASKRFESVLHTLLYFCEGVRQ
jgi:hypothetical protein